MCNKNSLISGVKGNFNSDYIHALKVLHKYRKENTLIKGNSNINFYLENELETLSLLISEFKIIDSSKITSEDFSFLLNVFENYFYRINDSRLNSRIFELLRFFHNIALENKNLIQFLPNIKIDQALLTSDPELFSEAERLIQTSLNDSTFSFYNEFKLNTYWYEYYLRNEYENTELREELENKLDSLLHFVKESQQNEYLSLYLNYLISINLLDNNLNEEEFETNFLEILRVYALIDFDLNDSIYNVKEYRNFTKLLNKLVKRIREGWKFKFLKTKLEGFFSLLIDFQKYFYDQDKITETRCKEFFLRIIKATGNYYIRSNDSLEKAYYLLNNIVKTTIEKIERTNQFFNQLKDNAILAEIYLALNEVEYLRGKFQNAFTYLNKSWEIYFYLVQSGLFQFQKILSKVEEKLMTEGKELAEANFGYINGFEYFSKINYLDTLDAQQLESLGSSYLVRTLGNNKEIDDYNIKNAHKVFSFSDKKFKTNFIQKLVNRLVYLVRFDITDEYSPDYIPLIIDLLESRMLSKETISILKYLIIKEIKRDRPISALDIIEKTLNSIKETNNKDAYLFLELLICELKALADISSNSEVIDYIIPTALNIINQLIDSEKNIKNYLSKLETEIIIADYYYENLDNKAVIHYVEAVKTYDTLMSEFSQKDFYSYSLELNFNDSNLLFDPEYLTTSLQSTLIEILFNLTELLKDIDSESAFKYALKSYDLIKNELDENIDSFTIIPWDSFELLFDLAVKLKDEKVIDELTSLIIWLCKEVIKNNLCITRSDIRLIYRIFKRKFKQLLDKKETYPAKEIILNWLDLIDFYKNDTLEFSEELLESYLFLIEISYKQSRYTDGRYYISLFNKLLEKEELSYLYDEYKIKFDNLLLMLKEKELL